MQSRPRFARLQAEIDRVEASRYPSPDAIVLAYGL
jgi:hypothetical protein